MKPATLGAIALSSLIAVFVLQHSHGSQSSNFLMEASRDALLDQTASIGDVVGALEKARAASKDVAGDAVGNLDSWQADSVYVEVEGPRAGETSDRVMLKRQFNAALKETASQLAKQNSPVYSGAIHTIPIIEQALALKDKKGVDVSGVIDPRKWAILDEVFMRAAGEVVRVSLDGKTVSRMKRKPESYREIRDDLKKRRITIRYLLGPYTWKPDPGIDLTLEQTGKQREAKHLEKFEQHARGAVQLILDNPNEIVFSPITLTHPLDVVLSGEGQTKGSDFWVDLDAHDMNLTNQATLFKFPGWDQSSGVKREMTHFKERGVKVKELEPNDFITSGVH